LIRKQLLITIVLVALTLVVFGVANAYDYYVDDNASDNSGDGKTKAAAWRTITYALSSSSGVTNGDTINVMPGTYSEGMAAPAEDFPLVIPCSDLTIVGIGSPILQKTVDATGSGERVFNCVSVDNVTIKFLDICNGSTTSNGGGIYIYNCQNITIGDCEIHDNTAYNTGGGISISNSSGLIDQNVIWDNTATVNKGGGIRVWAPTDGDNTHASQGEDSPLVIRDNCLYGNDACDSGGGIYLVSHDDSSHQDDDITYTGDGTWLFNNLIFSNTAGSSDAGGVQVGVDGEGKCAVVTLDNNTVAYNTYCGLYAEDDCCVNGKNNIFWENGSRGTNYNDYDVRCAGDDTGDRLNINWSDIDTDNAGTIYNPGNNNICSDPQWRSLGMDDMPCDGYFLDQTGDDKSPCVDAGNGDPNHIYDDDGLADWHNYRFYTDSTGDVGLDDNVIVDMGYHYKKFGGSYIELASFTAEARDGKVVVKWETATEIDNAGFMVYRCENEASGCHSVSRFIAANGDAVAGAGYSFTDVNVAPGASYYYYLVDIDTSGEWTAHGPVSARLPMALRVIELPTANSRLSTVSALIGGR